MNKWKTAFGVCLTVLVLVTALSAYTIIDQGLTITHMSEGYSETEIDLINLSKIIIETDQTKNSIKKMLLKNRSVENQDFSKDTISLGRVALIFKAGKLTNVTKQW